jgi:TonB family protein
LDSLVIKNSIKNKLLRHTFWLSALLHFLLFVCITTVIIVDPEKNQKPPQLYVPSYVYKGAITPSLQQPSRVASSVQKAHQRTRNEVNSQQTPDKPASKEGVYPKSMLAASFASIQSSTLKALSTPKNTEPILLIGDENVVADPLIKLLGRSLSAHFSYPKTEGMMGIKGKVIIGLTLHPDGNFSDVAMLRSSDNQNLDAAALYAVNSAPKVLGADRFLNEPKHFVVGFVFY